MTRIVLGVDNLGAYRPAVELVARLRFPEPAVTLIHAAAETLPYGGPAAPEVEERYAEVTMSLGHAALHEATTLVCGKELPCEAHLMHGNPAERLVREAEARGADLVAVNTKRAGVGRTSYIGSVGQALAVAGTASILVAKGMQGRRGTFRAVLATDHSPFAERCLDRFLELAPAGIEEIHVASAWELDDAEAARMGRNLPMLGGDADRWIEERVTERNAEVCARLEAAGYRARSMVRRGRPNEVIHHAMADVRADLLIVGSQGSGAMARSRVGSVSLHQTTAEFYPVLIVRPRESS